MIALLMCGGRGTRLGVGEKPLFRVCGKRLVDHSLAELEDCEVIAVTSPYTPETERYLRQLGVEVCRARGRGFIDDYREVCLEYKLSEPLLITSADIVYIRQGLIEDVISYYARSSCMSLKVAKNDKAVGINIIDAFFIDYVQEEEIYIVGGNDVINVNTLQDAKRAEELWMSTRTEERGWLRD